MTRMQHRDFAVIKGIGFSAGIIALIAGYESHAIALFVFALFLMAEKNRLAIEENRRNIARNRVDIVELSLFWTGRHRPSSSSSTTFTTTTTLPPAREKEDNERD